MSRQGRGGIVGGIGRMGEISFTKIENFVTLSVANHY